MKSAKVPHVLADNGLDAVETRSTFRRQQNHPPWRAKNGNDWASQSRDPQRPDCRPLSGTPVGCCTRRVLGQNRGARLDGPC